MTQLLSANDLFQLHRYNGLKVFLEDQTKRERYRGIILNFRQENVDYPEFSDNYLQIEILKGFLKLYATELKTIIYEINPEATDTEVLVYLELVSRYYIDFVDGHIQ